MTNEAEAAGVTQISITKRLISRCGECRTGDEGQYCRGQSANKECKDVHRLQNSDGAENEKPGPLHQRVAAWLRTTVEMRLLRLLRGGTTDLS